jgi:hypothetical protein
VGRHPKIECMAKLPLKRLYFDTNAAFRWPHPSDQFSQMLNLAGYVKTELYFPATVEAELESQFLRRIGELAKSLRSTYRELKTVCFNTIEVEIPDFLSADEQRENFKRRHEALKAHYAITTVPLTTIDLSLFVGMAINRKAPFEERTVGKERIVTGLQDAAIFMSILDHMKTAQPDDRCAFVSDDDVFQKTEIRSMIQERRLNLEIIKSPGLVQEDMWDHMWGEAKEAHKIEAEAITAELNASKEEYARQLKDILLPSQIRTGFFQSAVAINRLTILEIGSVYPDFPPHGHVPPNQYSRPEGSNVRITTTINVDVRVLVATSMSSFNIFNANDDDDDDAKPAPEPEQPPTLSRKKYTQRFSVTLAGTVREGRIVNMHIVEATAEKY